MVDWQLLKNVFSLSVEEALMMIMVIGTAIGGWIMTQKERSILEWTFYGLAIVFMSVIIVVVNLLVDRKREQQWRNRFGIA